MPTRRKGKKERLKLRPEVATPPRAKAKRKRVSKRPAPTAAFVGVGIAERVLSLDSSSKACGWAVFDDGHLVAYGRYLQEGKGHGERLNAFRSWLLAMFHQWAPHVVVYEAPYQGRMRHTFGILTRYVGVIEAAHFAHYGLEIEKECAVAAHLVKKAIKATRGRSHEDNKKIVVALVNKTFGLRLRFEGNDTKKQFSDDDDADAIALNWAWHVLYRSHEAPTAEEAA
jgi:Holliday junction resolvasome RuvABC endonuclease subunit